MGVRNVVAVVVGTVVCAVVAVVATAVVTSARTDHGDAVSELVARDMPRASDYSMVALPSSPAPDGAYVETSHYADPLADGQMVLLEYPGFTLYACSLLEGTSRPDSCATGDRTVLRTVRQREVVTTYSVGGKDVPARGALVDRVSRWVLSSSDFAKAPGWLSDYSEASLERMYRG
jgi:hypothetical protein